jgi:hypothetical protein
MHELVHERQSPFMNNHMFAREAHNNLMLFDARCLLGMSFSISTFLEGIHLGMAV